MARPPTVSQNRTANIVNFFLVLIAPLPWIIFVRIYTQRCDPLAPLCSLLTSHPLYFLNVVFFVTITVFFWFLGLLQRSTWLIDPYWTFIPLMIAHYYFGHPNSYFDESRAYLTMGLLYLWSVRLTHSYFRREEWNFGAREDWRFSDMQRMFPKQWWWMSFFFCYLSQQIFLVGITLPFYAIFTVDAPLNNWDILGALVCLVGIIGAYFADTQLRNFMISNEVRESQGLPKIPIFDAGLFYYCRHPNYFFEQLFWWGLWFFAWNLGSTWMFIGPLVNSCCLLIVSVWVEERMMRKKERERELKQYFQTTSAIIPWFKFKIKTE